MSKVSLITLPQTEEELDTVEDPFLQSTLEIVNFSAFLIPHLKGLYSFFEFSQNQRKWT